ncbi:MAG: methyltransferase domain-containing protein [Labedaea sp.]
MAETSLPPTFRLQDGAAGDAAQLAVVLDQLDRFPGVQRLRAWAREALRLLPGQSIVDVGSGTGEELAALAVLVGRDGSATGIEPHPGLRAEATRRAEESGSTARFVDGEAYALPLESSTVDAVRCERVFQHLDHPERAATELARVLRPGGRALVIDTDWATSILHPGDPEVLAALNRSLPARFPNPFSGRRLPGQLAAAGLDVVDSGSQALIQDPSAVDGMLAPLTDAAVATGVITETQRAQLEHDLRTGAGRGDFHFSVTMFAYLAVKPKS